MTDSLPEDIEEQINKKIKPRINNMIDEVIEDRYKNDVKENIQYWVGENKARSALMFENLAPTDKYPKGRILIHVDSTLRCGGALKNSPMTYLIFQILQAISFWIKFQSKGYDYILKEQDKVKSKSFAKTYCKKLYNKGYIKDEPIDISQDHEAAMSYALFIKEWTGMGLAEYIEYVESNFG